MFPSHLVLLFITEPHTFTVNISCLFTPQSWQPDRKNHCGFQHCLLCCQRGHRQVTEYVSCKCWLTCDVCHSFSCMQFWSECSIYRITLYFQLLIGEINHTLLSGFPGKFTRGCGALEPAVFSWGGCDVLACVAGSIQHNPLLPKKHMHTFTLLSEEESDLACLLTGVTGSRQVKSSFCHFSGEGLSPGFCLIPSCVFLPLDPGIVIADLGCEILCQCRWFVWVK